MSSYNENHWKDSPETEITAEKLNNQEQGIKDAHDGENTPLFLSYDNAKEVTEILEVDSIAKGDTLSIILSKLTKFANNVRWLFNFLKPTEVQENGYENLPSMAEAVQDLKNGTEWKVCTLTPNKSKGDFASDNYTAYYRYDDYFLEIYLYGSYVASTTISKNDVVFTISDIEIDIPDGQGIPVWNDSADEWTRINLNTNGNVNLSSDVNITTGQWIAFSGSAFRVYRK